MPKRPVTPPIDDGAKYLTVVYPYPVRPNMEFEEHRKLFAQWIAACIGPHHLRAFYHKPTSPGSIIVEVDESLPDFKQLLGAHKWSQFLKDPKGQGDNVSRVFYCTYNSDRIVQKNGWKRIDVQDRWFKQSKAASKFVFPYPDTRWCDIPKIGNVIQNDLCRPLPGQEFPPPPPPRPAPVVGTPEWQEWKRTQESTRVTRVRAWTRDAPLESINTTPPVSSSNSTPATRAPSGSSTPAYPPQAWRSTTPLSPPGLPPGLVRGGSSASSQTSSGSGKSALDGVPFNGSPSPPSDPHSSSSASSDGDIQPLSPTDDDPHVPVTIAGDDVEHGLAMLCLEDDEEEYDEDTYYSLGAVSVVDGAQEFPLLDAQEVEYAMVGPAEVQESLWGDYVNSDEDDEDDDDDDDDDDLKFDKASRKKPELCKVHNVVCKKGICKVYAAQLREKKHREREEERRKQREEALAKRNKKMKKDSEDGSSTASTPTSGSSTPSMRAPPPHLRAGAPAPPPGSGRQLPPHLKRGATPASPPPPVSPHASGRITPTPSRQQADDDARSQSSDSCGNGSEGPWGPAPTRTPSGGGRTKIQTANPPAPPKVRGAWGGAPSISASSVQRNNDSWSVSARTSGDDDGASVAGADARAGTQAAAPPKSWGAWGRAPSISASSVRRNNDSWSASGRDDDARSVAASVATGWGTTKNRDRGAGVGAGVDGPWGSSDAVRAAAQPAGHAKKTWAEQMEEASAVGDDVDDGRSVAESTDSAATWGNVSAGPW